jgi:GH15 family glucan-1,4-alpha-glucosidase
MSVPRISDYALIGNCRSAALVGRNGSIEWCCLPEFHSPAIFAALLDREKGGYFSIAPVGPWQSSQGYLPATNVAETRFQTEEGEARLVDAFVALTEEEKRAALFPDTELLRVVEGVAGVVRLKMEYVPRPFYGRGAASLQDHQKLGVQCAWKGSVFNLLCTLGEEQVQVAAGDPGRATAEFEVRPGERVIFSLSYSAQSPAVLPELRITAWKRLQATIHYWSNWIGRCRYTGIYQEQVRRSALVLKLLAHAPSGAIIAAPTTSLPETLGGIRNWDYRYCWLRDASFTTRVLVQLGFEEEAHAYLNWILHATRLTRPRLQVVYSVYGHAKLKEQTLDWLQGYRGSRPVRIGNGADGQFQLDVYGEVLDAVYTYSSLVKEFDRDSRRFIMGLGDVLCKLWSRPDNGIWEVRSVAVHHTHSKVMAWVGLDRLVRLAQKYHWKEAPVARWKQAATLIRQEIESFGFNPKLNAYTRELNGSTLDACLLTLPLVGYCDAASPRMLSTTQLIHERLSENNLVYRYRATDDGLSGREGSFGICNFWLAENYARAGRLDRAREVFETMLQHASPAGLLSEEVDPQSHELLGNYPQGFTHIGLINAALSINKAYQQGGPVL